MDFDEIRPKHQNEYNMNIMDTEENICKAKEQKDDDSEFDVPDEQLTPNTNNMLKS